MLPSRLRRIIDLFARLPGVGEKTAQRFAMHLVGASGELARDLGRELAELAEHVRPCEKCGNVAEVGESGLAECPICADSRRDAHVLCIVARVQDLLAVELPLRALFRRIESDGVEEVILATPPSVDGEATALLLARELAGRSLRISRIASGVPHGGDLEFADQITLGRAIDGRRRLD